MEEVCLRVGFCESQFLKFGGVGAFSDGGSAKADAGPPFTSATAILLKNEGD
jgi:hypothetical protein